MFDVGDKVTISKKRYEKAIKLRMLGCEDSWDEKAIEWYGKPQTVSYISTRAGIATEEVWGVWEKNSLVPYVSEHFDNNIFHI